MWFSTYFVLHYFYFSLFNPTISLLYFRPIPIFVLISYQDSWLYSISHQLWRVYICSTPIVLIECCTLTPQNRYFGFRKNYQNTWKQLLWASFTDKQVSTTTIFYNSCTFFLRTTSQKKHTVHLLIITIENNAQNRSCNWRLLFWNWLS